MSEQKDVKDSGLSLKEKFTWAAKGFGVITPAAVGYIAAATFWTGIFNETSVSEGIAAIALMGGSSLTSLALSYRLKKQIGAIDNDYRVNRRNEYKSAMRHSLTGLGVGSVLAILACMAVSPSSEDSSSDPAPEDQIEMPDLNNSSQAFVQIPKNLI